MATQWQVVREVLNDDDELLATILGIKAISSMRRYAKGERACPVEVIPRLHWLALLIQQLEGTYLTLAPAASFGTVAS